MLLQMPAKKESGQLLMRLPESKFALESERELPKSIRFMGGGLVGSAQGNSENRHPLLRQAAAVRAAWSSFWRRT
jgi:hypothetical protein